MSERLPRTVGLLGGGVIGGGWAARFVLNGVDVKLYDPAPGAVERVQEILTNARRAYQQLTQVPLPAEGSLTMVESVEDAVHGVELVQRAVEIQERIGVRVMSPDEVREKLALKVHV